MLSIDNLNILLQIGNFCSLETLYYLERCFGNCMKVDKIYQNCENSGGRVLQNAGKRNISFSKKVPLSNRIMEELPNKKLFKGMKKWEYLRGEAGGILITAIGTGAVAPFPIAFNPFVKAPKGASPEEKKELQKTKEYTAWRQPISAGLAILFQLSALKPIDMFLDFLFNESKLAKNMDPHFSQVEINGKSYIERLAKKKIKAEQPSLKGKKYDELLEITKKEIEDSQVNNVAEKLQKTGKIMIGDKSLDNKSLATLVNAQIDAYVNDAKALKIDNKGLAYYSEKAKMLMENEAHLKEIFKDVPNDKAKITDFVKNLYDKEQNSDVKTLLKEILDKPSDIQYHRIERSLSRIERIKDMCDGQYSHEKYFDAMSKRNYKLDNLITEFLRMKIKDPKSASDAKITETIENVTKTCSFEKSDKLMNSILHDTNTFDFDKAKLSNKVHKDIAKQYKDFVRNHYKGLNQIFKIFIGVCITLPITCNVLNWVYPRFMNTFLPNLANAKKAQKAREVK